MFVRRYEESDRKRVEEICQITDNAHLEKDLLLTLYCHYYITYEKENYTKESALKYFTSRSDSFLMHEKTSKLMLEILTRISIVGEKQALKEYKKRPKLN